MVFCCIKCLRHCFYSPTSSLLTQGVLQWNNKSIVYFSIKISSCSVKYNVNIELSIDQKNAFQTVLDWAKSKDKNQFLTLGGYAGTGKSTLIGFIRKKLQSENANFSVAFCSYTGKAARVLKGKLKEAQAALPSDSVSTIHSLIYSPQTNNKGEIIGWQRKEKISANLIIVDEASMIDSEIWNDLVSYKIPILAVGDHGQLPPIRGSFNLMQNPEVKLEQIHRQAADNPIIKLSETVRKFGFIPAKDYGNNIKKVKKGSEDSRDLVGDLLESYNQDMLVLCGFNSTRNRLNTFVRKSLGFESEFPQSKDRVVCLRNNHEKEVYNGMLGTVYSAKTEDDDWVNLRIEMDGEQKLYEGFAYLPQFGAQTSFSYSQERPKTLAGDLFDFGYALTVHKAQGSQAPRVLLFEERSSHMKDEEWRRWLYTGVTRAEKELFVVG